MTTFNPRRRRLAAALAGGTALLAAGAWRAARATPATAPSERPDDPRPDSTRLDVTWSEADWIDTTRERAVPVRLYRPLHSQRGDGALPLVVFSHGLGGSRRGYSYLGTHFARHGWASLHVQHVGSDRAVWGGNPFSLAQRLRAAAQEREAIDRVLDLRFALDTLLAGADAALALPVDPTRIVVAGHSYGANTALLASGARIERAGRVVPLRDERFAAAVVLSAPPFHGEPALAPILSPIAVPSLHVTATGDDIRVPGYASGVTDRIAVFQATGGPHKVLAVFEGGSHSIFTDRAGTGGVELNPRVKRATQELATAFIDHVFDGRDAALRTWRERHREIVARFDAPPLG